MKKFTMSGLPVLIALLAFLGVAPAAKALTAEEVYSSVTMSPPCGEIDDINKLATVTMSMPAGYTASSAQGALGKIYLYKVENGENGEQLSKFSSAVDKADNKFTFTYKGTDLSELGEGTYRMVFTKANDIRIYDGATSFGVPANYYYEWTYVKSASASVKWEITPTANTIVKEADFNGITVSFPEAKSVAVNEDNATTDNISIKLNGEDVSGMPQISRDWLTFNWRGEKEGIVEFTLAKGFYDVTMADGSVIPSPEVSTKFYLGDLNVTTTPANGSVAHPFEVLRINFPKNVTPSINYSGMKEMSVSWAKKTLSYGEGTLILNDVAGLEFVPGTEDDEYFGSLTAVSTVKVYVPEGGYNIKAGSATMPMPWFTSTFTTVPTSVTLPKAVTVPAAGSSQETLSEFSFNYEGVNGIAKAEGVTVGADDITLSYEDTVLKYGTDITADASDITKMKLAEALAPLKPTKVTMHIAAGLYTLTLSDGKTLPAPAIDVTFTVGKAIPFTTTPKAGAKMDKLEQFGVAFEGVSEVAWSDTFNPSDITLKCGDKEYSYTDGFLDGDEITDMVLEEALAPITPTECTVRFAPGVYALTLADGSVAESSEIEFTFTVGREVAYAITPANTAALNELSEFAINFEGVKNVVFSDTFKNSDITVKYGDTTLEYGTAIVKGDADNKLTLATPITSSKGMEVSVSFAEGAYTLTCDDDMVVPSPAAEITYTIETKFDIDTESWIPVTSTDQLDVADGRDCILVWYYNGVKSAASSSDMDKAPMIEMGEQSCSTVSTQVITDASKTYRGSAEIATYRTADNAAKQILAIKNIPADAAVVRIKKEADGYTIYNNNGDTQGYFAPGYDKNVNRAFLNTADEPYYNSITIDSKGAAKIVSNYRNSEEGFNVLSVMTDFMSKSSVYQFVDQAYGMGNLYIFTKYDADVLFGLNATPANGSESAYTKDGVQKITMRFGTFDQATANENAAAPTATFAGEALAADAITTNGSYPVELSVALPTETEGELVINIPAGWYHVTGEAVDGDTPAYTYKLNIVAPKVIPVADITVTTDPANGSKVGEITTINVIFPDNVAKVEFNEEVALTENIVSMLDGQPTTKPAVQSETVFRFRPEFTTAGEYTFGLPESFYLLTMTDGSQAYSPAIQTVFTVDPSMSVDSIFGDAEAADVYTVTGIRVLKDATPEQFKSLAPGIYVVSGRKVLKK